MLSEVKKCCKATKLTAKPHSDDDPTSFWVIEGSGSGLEGTSSAGLYRARLGIETKLEAVFRVRIIKRIGPNTVLVENNLDRAKIEVPHINATVEDALLLPYVTGASIQRWTYEVAGYYIVPHTAETGMAPLSMGVMRTMYPLTFAYLKTFEKQLERRTIHKRWGNKNPFYSMYGIGPYTFAPYRLAWKRTTRDFGAVVLSTSVDAFLGERIVVPNGKVMIVAFDDENRAHYLCGLLNSCVARARINRSITSEAHSEIINVVPLTSFDQHDSTNRKIATLSKSIHEAFHVGNRELVSKLEDELDHVVATLWSVSDDELVMSRQSLER
jgi:hypothetical protein